MAVPVGTHQEFQMPSIKEIVKMAACGALGALVLVKLGWIDGSNAPAIFQPSSSSTTTTSS